MNRIVAALLAAALALAGPLPARADGTVAPRSAMAEPAAPPVPAATEPREAAWPALLGFGGTVGGIVMGYYVGLGIRDQLEAHKHCGIPFGCMDFMSRADQSDVEHDVCQCCKLRETFGLMRILQSQSADFGIMDLNVPPLQRLMILRDFAFVLSMSTTGEFKTPSVGSLLENDMDIAAHMRHYRMTASNFCTAAFDRKRRDLDERLAREGR